LAERGSLFSFGANDEGQLGHGDMVNCRTPQVVKSLSSHHVRHVICGPFHTFAMCGPFENTDKNTVWAWGLGSDYQLGTKDRSTHSLPVEVSSIFDKAPTLLSAGWSHSIAIG